MLRALPSYHSLSLAMQNKCSNLHLAAPALTAAAPFSSLSLSSPLLMDLSPLPHKPELQLKDVKNGLELLSLFQRSSSQQPLLVITGAGLSTASGLPDYRSPNRPAYKPLQHQQFMSDPAVRRRYWSRSFVGWHNRTGSLKPNAGHFALAKLQREGFMAPGLITQNVERLHHKAGSEDVLELHGNIVTVKCHACNSPAFSRDSLQQHMHLRNAHWLEHWLPRAAPRPDGDVELPEESYASFSMPLCPFCRKEHLVKPCVVFHGGSIAPEVKQEALRRATAAGSMLLLGSTATVWSCFRLVRAVAEAGKPVAVLNHGETRADSFPGVIKVDEHISSVLQAVCRELGLGEANQGQQEEAEREEAERRKRGGRSPTSPDEGDGTQLEGLGG